MTTAPSATTAPGTPRAVGAAAAPVKRVLEELVVDVALVVDVEMVVGLVTGGLGVFVELEDVIGFGAPVPDDEAARLLLRVPELTVDDAVLLHPTVAVAVTVTV